MNKVFIHTIKPSLPGEKITFDVPIPLTVKEITGIEITVSHFQGGGVNRDVLTAGELKFRWNNYPEVFLALNCMNPAIYQDEYWIMKQPYTKALWPVDFPNGGTKSIPLHVSISACQEYLQGIYEDSINRVINSSNPYTVKIYFHYEEL